jgi:integrase/recombinase XerD
MGPMDITIRKFINYLKEEKNRAENTLIAYETDLNQFAKSLVELTGRPVAPQELKDEILNKYIAWLQNRQYRPATITRKWATVRSFISFLQTQGVLLPRKLGDQVYQTTQPRQKPVGISIEQVNRLFALAAKSDRPLDQRDLAILNLLYHKGLRAGDIVALRVEDVDLYRRTLRLPDEPLKSIPIDEAIGPLKTYLEEGRPHLSRNLAERALFLNQRSKGLTRQGVWLIVKRWANEAGMDKDVSPNTLRHSLAYHLIENGVNPKIVQRRLRLTSPNSVRIYES